ncbi:MAG: ribonuclease R [Bacilli bacterium]|nr:ribonuclease R [Bacilli bacterium]MDD4809191.1 ribonuclease R [Bacilli bacterium]
MEEQILELLKKSKKALTVYEINDAFNLKTADELKDLLKVLNKMEDELKLYRSKKDSYLLFNNSHMKVGTLLANKKGFGFVDIVGNEDVYISQSNMKNAIHGDKVVIEITSPKGVDLEGRIVKILARDLKQMVGEFYYKSGKGYIDLDNEKVKITIEIDDNKTMGAMNGHKVLVKVMNKLQGNNYKGEVVKILGHKNDPGVDILSIVNSMGINDVFSDEVMDEVEKLPIAVTEEDMIGRKDLRHEEIFTIDGDDAKDLDDAISLRKLDNGNYLLGVHIADVSYYVKEGSKIDVEAYERGTSVYLADRVIPMLPHKLSNGICSLNGNVDRLAVTCEMEVDHKGNVVNYDIYESVINSKKRMTYNHVNAILEKNEIPEGYEAFIPTLQNMMELAHIIRKNKEIRGFIDFDIDESKIIVDEKGEAIDVTLRERGEGELLIEDFMIIANETVATHIYFMELPFVYRIHGEPNEEKVQSFLKFIGFLGYKVNGKIKDITPKTMQGILNDLKDKKEFHLLSNLLLRSMQKAVYDKENIGHFGIASKCYTHFTSPIRRYPDTTVHRLLRLYTFEHKLDPTTINYWDNKLPFLTQHASERERTAIECERQVDDMKKAEYMSKHIGEEYEGMISSVLSFGMFVELDNLIEGLVRLDDLTDDHYYFDESTFSIRGQKNKRGYRLGDVVKVIVKTASKENRTIDFQLVKPINEKEKIKMKKK